MKSILLVTLSCIIVLLFLQDADTRGIQRLLKKWAIKKFETTYKRAGRQGLTDHQKTEMLAVHNALRLQEGSPRMPMLTWDDSLASLSQQWSDGCADDHRSSDMLMGAAGYEYVGENLFATTDPNLDPTEAVRDWYSEKEFYDYKSNTCDPNQMCGHYTQVVWAGTTRVGCGMTFCPFLAVDEWENAYLVVCNYGEGGNYEGERPY